jgi:hypothetical protein
MAVKSSISLVVLINIAKREEVFCGPDSCPQENYSFFLSLLRRLQRQGFRSFENQGVHFCE